MVAPAPRIIISGLGLISPLGHSAWQTFSALLGGSTLADRAGCLPPDIEPFDLVRALGGVSICQHTMTDPAVELAERAAREALFDARTHPHGLDCYLGTSKGAIHALTHAADTPENCPEAVALGPHGYMTYHLRRRLGLGATTHIVAACASSLHALHLARLALIDTSRPNAPRRALVATAESAMLPLFVHSYTRLGVLAPTTTRHYRACPLDEKRKGFMLAELGAAVLLERVDEAAPGQIELLDTAVASESYDLIRPSPEMRALAHVAEQLLPPHHIDLLHPHAPGTPDHDEAELAVYAKTLSRPGTRTPKPDLYAAKGALGHGLGAAGLVSLVIACLCAKANRRPPMPWLKQPIDSAFPLKPQASSLKPASTHAVFAAGFGGHVAGTVVRTV